jgi:LytTr DNA-binding domain
MSAAHPRPLASSRNSQLQLNVLIGIAATVLALLTTAQAGVALAHDGQAVPWVGLLKARLVDWYACALFVPALCALVRRYPLNAGRWASHLPILLLAALPVAFAKEVIFVAVGNFFRPGVFDFATILAEDFSHEVIAVWALLGIAHLLVTPAPTAGVSRSGIRVLTRQGPEWISEGDIELVDAQGNYARLVTPRGRFLVRQTMAELERQLGGAFVRVHRSVIVRRDRVASVERAANGRFRIILVSGERVTSGRSYRDAVRTLRPAP